MSKEISPETVEQNAFFFIDDFRKKLIQCPAYLQALTDSLRNGSHLRRPDKSIRFRVGDNLIDVIDEYIRDDIQLFTIRRRGVDSEVYCFDANDEYIHLCAVKDNDRLSSSIVYCNRIEKINEKNSLRASVLIAGFSEYLKCV